MKNRLNLSLPKRKKKPHKPRTHIDWGEVVHVTFNTVLPFVLVVLVNLELQVIAVLVAVFSKWRMFAVRPNHLPANIRANATDLIVKLSLLSFIIRYEDLAVQLILATAYSVWLLLIKPQTSNFWVSLQATISQVLGITALMWFSESIHEIVLLFGIWGVVYVTTFHYLSDFDEKISRLLAKIWAMLGVQFAWLFFRWNLVYFGFIPQYALFQVAISYVGAEIYRAHRLERLNAKQVRASVISALIIITALILSADWTGKIIL